jgi:hypothetical protein
MSDSRKCLSCGRSLTLQDEHCKRCGSCVPNHWHRGKKIIGSILESNLSSQELMKELELEDWDLENTSWLEEEEESHAADKATTHPSRFLAFTDRPHAHGRGDGSPTQLVAPLDRLTCSPAHSVRTPGSRDTCPALQSQRGPGSSE